MNGTSPAWSWRHAFARSSLPATTKHVLHTLGMFMNELGEGCYPSVADICRYSGLDKKTVLKHLATAREAGWIAVAQHGYRGQKWKRQEYAARWPERDLVAACAPEPDDSSDAAADDAAREEDAAERAEGGGAAPPPCAAGKVVESAPEGGGIEGSKVVEQLHQDKTSPDTTPDTSPERAGARAREGTDREDRKRAEARGWRLLARWPGFAGMPKNRAMKAWMALDAAAQDRAERRFDAWLAQLKAQRKDHVPAPSTYFGEGLFDEVADPVDAVPPVEAKPFGKAGMALRLARLVAGPTFTVLRLSAFEERMVADGKADRAALMAAKQAAQGYPLVTQMDEQRALTVAPEVAALGEGFVAARRGDDRFADWERLHARRGWPWLPPWVEWVWLPPGAAETAMAQFEAAMRGQGDDDAAGRTAAE